MSSSSDDIVIWRIVHSKYKDDAFSGKGAEQYGGRFNSKGRPVVYASGSLSLSVLEMLVQTNSRERLQDHICFPVNVSASFIAETEFKDLPDGWDALPYGRASQEFGDSWIDDATSVVLRIPSVVNKLEFNYLINPAHSDFAHLEIGDPIPFPVYPRLLKEMGT